MDGDGNDNSSGGDDGNGDGGDVDNHSGVGGDSNSVVHKQQSTNRDNSNSDSDSGWRRQHDNGGSRGVACKVARGGMPHGCHGSGQ